MTDRLGALVGAHQTLELLEVAAYFGARFDVRDIAEFRDMSVEDVESLLWKTLHQGTVELSLYARYDADVMLARVRSQHRPQQRAGFVLREGDFEYRFLHDRVQQAAYECVDRERSKHMHLGMAKFMLTRVDLDEDVNVHKYSSAYHSAMLYQSLTVLSVLPRYNHGCAHSISSS
jgi:predicted ATPase